MAKDLESFLRDCRAVQMDRGHLVGEKWDTIVQELRHRFEVILGNRPRSFTDMVKEKIQGAMEGAHNLEGRAMEGVGQMGRMADAQVGRAEAMGRGAMVDVEKRGMNMTEREAGEWGQTVTRDWDRAVGTGVREWNQVVGRGAVAFDQAAARGMAAVEQRGQQVAGRM